MIKADILLHQKSISKLEIQNNLLRKEIHNSQFERIKLLKKVNEISNQCDQVKWEKEKVRIDTKSKLMIDSIRPANEEVPSS